MLEKKKTILIIFNERKKETPNPFFFEKKFSIIFNTKIIYISDYFDNSNHLIAKNLNEIIKKENVSIVLFQGDGLSIIDVNFINLIDQKVKKGMLIWDDPMYHYTNRITASACDFILSGCPLSILKFQELGYTAKFLPVETSGSIFKDLKEKKIYDVLFFGRQKNNRTKFISYLKENNIKLFICGPYDEISNTFEKLNKLINQSKIVINFTEQDNTKYNYNPLSSFNYNYSLKGRVYFTGLSNSLCISEYNPSAELLFKNEELPYFKNKEDCLMLIKGFLSNDSKLKEATIKYKNKCIELEDNVYMHEIKEFLEKTPKKNEEIQINIPSWYEYIYLKKNILVRFKKNKFSSFFTQIYELIFKRKFINKKLVPVILLFMLLISTLFILKFPFLKLKK